MLMCTVHLSQLEGAQTQTHSAPSLYTQFRAPDLCSADTEGPVPLQHLFL